MFQVSMRHVPTIRDFAEAERQWAARNPWRSGDPDEKMLGSRHQKNLKLHHVDDGGIAAKLYNLDVITWYPDGRTRFVGYGTTATQCLVREMVPGVLAHFTGRGYSIAQYDTKLGDYVFRGMLDGEMWRLPDGSWDPMHCVSYEDYRADRKAMNAAYKQFGLPAFIQWLTAFRAMGGKRPEGYVPAWGWSPCLSMLQDGIEGWQQIAWATTLDEETWRRWGSDMRARQQANTDRGMLQALRKQIWQQVPGCVVETHTEQLVGWDALRSWERRASQYARLF